MKKIIFILIFAIVPMLSSSLFSADAVSVEGSWKGIVKGRKNRDFNADIGVRKVGDIYIVRGISLDKRISWYGTGTFNGGTLEYTYKIRKTGIHGKATLKLTTKEKSDASGEKDVKPEFITILDGEFEEGVTRMHKGNESWKKVIFKKPEYKTEKDRMEKDKKKK